MLEHGEPTHGFFVYDTTLRVPLLIRAPGFHAPGVVVRSAARLIDIAPTILAHAGLPIPPQMQGENLLPSLREPTAATVRRCYGENLGPQITHGYAMLRSLHEGDWKYVHAPRPELYNIASDHGEQRNLADAEPQRVATMRAALREVIASAPTPVGDGRVTPDEHERARLESLGYIAASSDAGLELGPELERFEPVGKNPMERGEAMSCMVAGKGALNNRNVVLAERLLRRLLELEPDHALGLCTLGQTLIVAERFDEARDLLRKAIELKPDQCEAYRLLGTLRAMDAEYEWAERRYREALLCNPADHLARMKLARVLSGLKRVDEGLAEWKKLVDEVPGVAAYELHYGKALLDAKRATDSIERFRAAIRLDGSLHEARVKLAEALEAQGDLDAAEDTLERLLEVATDSSMAYVSMAGFLERRGAWARAIDTMRRGLELLPNDLEVAVNLAWYLSICPDLQLRNGAEALDLAQRVNRATGDNNPVALETLALAFAACGQFEDAVRVGRRAMDRATAAGQGEFLARVQARLSYFEKGTPVPGP